MIANNNLPKAQAKALEQRLIATFGGAKSINPATHILNKIRSFSPMNKNAAKYKQSVNPQQWREVRAAVRARTPWPVNQFEPAM